ncbi:MAG TPA: hypothetical protein VF218_10550 [Acidothermaceae bacterium]|jgi:hypothetical protein
MTERQLATRAARGGLPAADGRWCSLVDACALVAGPFDPALLLAWRAEMDRAQARVAGLGDAERAGDASDREAPDPLPVGVHALLTLAGARVGEIWRTTQLIDAAAAVELARRAVLQHQAVRDSDLDARRLNRRHVLCGDWCITQASRLVADIGPSAYRVLVRGWGSAQLTRLRTGATSRNDVLFDTAISLGALTAGVPTEVALLARRQPGAIRRVHDWAARL